VSKYVDGFQEVHGDAADFRGRGAKIFQGYRLHRVGHVRKKFKTIFLSILVLTPSEEVIVKKKRSHKKGVTIFLSYKRPLEKKIPQKVLDYPGSTNECVI
jgi:hypothetical protein